MGRTVPSFRIVLAEEKQEWKPFRDVLDKKEKKEFDEMWDIPRLYVSACSNSCQLVPLQPIVISILFHHYKELLRCVGEVKELGAEINAKEEGNIMKYSTIEEEEAKRIEAIPTALDSYLNKSLTVHNNDSV
jgi:hypothetical protein